MIHQIFKFLKHLVYFILGISFIAIIVFFATGNTFKYGRNPVVDTLDREGPYVFFESDSLFEIQYIKGDRTQGFEVEKRNVNTDTPTQINCFYPLDSCEFNVELNSNFDVPAATYMDSDKILAISDFESNFKTMRDFLIQNNVINEQLEWQFGTNHLVLVGDLIDRSYYTTQLLWFVYKLEQDAAKVGGRVHYILGNHEILNMQGIHNYAKYKYQKVAEVFAKQQDDFYNKSSYLGRWLHSKNTMEVINGNLFVHG
jgi:hypothetical protein